MSKITKNKFTQYRTINLTNDFAIKTFVKSLPEEMDGQLYKLIKIAIFETQENKKMGKEKIYLKLFEILVEVYSFRKLEESDIFVESELQYLIAQYSRGLNFLEMIHNDIQLTKFYINRTVNDKGVARNYIINMVIGLMILKTTREEDLDLIIKSTKDNFDKAIKKVSGYIGKISTVAYDKENIVNGVVFLEVKKLLNDYLYKNEELEFEFYKTHIKEEIRSNCFEYVIKRILLGEGIRKDEVTNEIQCDIESVRLHNTIAKTFQIEEYEGEVYIDE